MEVCVSVAALYITLIGDWVSMTRLWMLLVPDLRPLLLAVFIPIHGRRIRRGIRRQLGQ